MRPYRLVLAVVLFLVGAVWVGQGVGAIHGSAMTGSSFWEVIGAGLVVAALVLGATGVRRSGAAR